jgi:hypothetical protein
MLSTPNMSAIVADALDETMRDAWRELVGKGQDANDVSKAKRRPWAMTLRFLTRAKALGVPKARVMAFCAAVTAYAEATYPDDDTATLTECSLAEEQANHDLNAVQITLAGSPCVSRLLEAKQRVRRQIEATWRFGSRIDRELHRFAGVR